MIPEPMLSHTSCLLVQVLELQLLVELGLAMHTLLQTSSVDRLIRD